MKATTTLFFRDGSSDKMYVATLDGNQLTLAWGRRGSAMQTKSVTGPSAASEYEKKIAEKRAKGYVEGTNGTAMVAARATSIPDDVPRPMLLNEITREELLRLIADADWWAQEKHDGDRKLIRWTGFVATAYSRTGRTADAIPAPVIAALEKYAAGQVLIDGELVGDTFFAFDLLEYDGTDLRDDPYMTREHGLIDLFGKSKSGIVVVKTARKPSEKIALFEALTKRGAEGVVLKNRRAAYKPNRPNTGGPALKFKFVATASVIVARHHPEHRSVRMKMACGTDVGSVSIPINKQIPPVGCCIEVKYLYAYRGGSLVQSVFLGMRDDVEKAACTMEQLKFKDEPVGASRFCQSNDSI